MNKPTLIIIVLILLIIGGIAYIIASNTDSIEVETVTFSAEGNVTRDNPGQKAEVWYFVYDEAGSPARTLELDFSSTTIPTLTRGDRVEVEGLLTDPVLLVSKITIVEKSDEAEDTQSVRISFYNQSLDQGPGGPQCGKSGIVSVVREIPKTETPLRDTIELLLKSELTAEEKTQGLTTEFPLPGLTLKSASIDKGKAILTFDDPQGKTSGGSCRVSILREQIEKTAVQFPGITSVELRPVELFQP